MQNAFVIHAAPSPITLLQKAKKKAPQAMSTSNHLPSFPCSWPSPHDGNLYGTIPGTFAAAPPPPTPSATLPLQSFPPATSPLNLFAPSTVFRTTSTMTNHTSSTVNSQTPYQSPNLLHGANRSLNASDAWPTQGLPAALCDWQHSLHHNQSTNNNNNNQLFFASFEEKPGTSSPASGGGGCLGGSLGYLPPSFASTASFREVPSPVGNQGPNSSGSHNLFSMSPVSNSPIIATTATAAASPTQLHQLQQLQKLQQQHQHEQQQLQQQQLLQQLMLQQEPLQPHHHQQHQHTQFHQLSLQLSSNHGGGVYGFHPELLQQQQQEQQHQQQYTHHQQQQDMHFQQQQQHLQAFNSIIGANAASTGSGGGGVGGSLLNFVSPNSSLRSNSSRGSPFHPPQQPQSQLAFKTSSSSASSSFQPSTAPSVTVGGRSITIGTPQSGIFNIIPFHCQVTVGGGGGGAAAGYAATAAKAKKKASPSKMRPPYDLPLSVRRRLPHKRYFGRGSLTEADGLMLLGVPAAVLEAEGIPPSVYPPLLGAVNRQMLAVLEGEEAISWHTSDDAGSTRQGAKTRAGTFMEVPLRSYTPPLRVGEKQIPETAPISTSIPARTLKMYSPDLTYAFQIPVHHLHCTQGLLAYLVDVAVQGSAVSKTRLTICPHIYETYLRPWLKHIDSLAQVSAEGSPLPSFQRSVEQARSELFSTDEGREPLPEERVPTFPAPPTRWAPPGEEQPPAVYAYSLALAGLYAALNAGTWCPQRSRCNGLHPHLIPTHTRPTGFAPHPSLTWTTVHQTIDLPDAHQRFSPGCLIPMSTASDTAVVEEVPSERAFVTRGALEFIEKVVDATHAAAIIPSTSRVLLQRLAAASEKSVGNSIARVEVGRPDDDEGDEGGELSCGHDSVQQCAHYAKGGVCSRGVECMFLHVTSGMVQSPRPPPQQRPSLPFASTSMVTPTLSMSSVQHQPISAIPTNLSTSSSNAQTPNNHPDRHQSSQNNSYANPQLHLFPETARGDALPASSQW